VQWKRVAWHKQEQLSCRDVVEVDIVTYHVSVQVVYLRSEASVATCDHITRKKLACRMVEWPCACLEVEFETLGVRSLDDCSGAKARDCRSCRGPPVNSAMKDWWSTAVKKKLCFYA